MCEECIEGSFIKQFDDAVDRQGIETKVSEASSGINIIPEHSLNWVSETLSARRVHSPARVNAYPMGTQAVNDETQATPQISATKGAELLERKKRHSGSWLTGVAQLQIGEKENKVVELSVRVLCGKSMSGDAKKGSFTTDILLGEKVAEEQRIEGPDETLGNQSKGDRLDIMGYEANRDRAECSKAQITQEESDGLEIHLATLLKKKKGAFRERGQQSQELARSHRKKKRRRGDWPSQGYKDRVRRGSKLQRRKGNAEAVTLTLSSILKSNKKSNGRDSDEDKVRERN
ncbi:hypothetical protein Ancab_027575 [Ancistrocladus abbreviatus]